ncbi:hormogonium polysaccharide biosynthesis protein HpsA [Phormidium nigroviride]
MFKRKLAKVIVSLLRRIANVSRAGAKRLMRAMLRSLMAMGRRAKLPVAGFVLPTVTMVMLVVVLLTLAITLRSFDRAQNARNVRVNQAVLAAASPALDRAQAKINYLLKEDPQRPTATPSDNEMYRIISASDTLAQTPPRDLYTFGDETRLRLRYDLNGNTTIDPDPANDTILEDNEAINTAWRYAVDTDNNGQFDTYTLYGIFFRSPERDGTTGKFTRARKPLESRTPPMPAKLSDPACAGAVGTSASLVGDSGWYKSEGRLKKSFFVYTVNLPITNPDTSKNEEAFKGTTSFSALEYQQDQSRIPLSNNAVVYEDDLEISAFPTLTINGRIFTNSNLLVTTNTSLVLSQVSSQSSCFYEQENSKIIVAGNLVNAGVLSTTPVKDVNVHLFKKLPTAVDTSLTISATNQSVSNTAPELLYNTKAYADRLALLVSAQIKKDPATDPTTVKEVTAIATNPVIARELALKGYFKERLRKVPFAEVVFGADATAPYTEDDVLAGSGDTLRPVDATGWNLPDGWTAEQGTDSAPGLTIKLKQPPATYPNPEEPLTEEGLLGDRLQLGNNLPAQRWDDVKAEFVGLGTPQQVDDGSTKWDAGDTTKNRTRTPRITQLADVGATERGQFWEEAAAQKPKTAVDGIGGLRVVTGGGVYERVNSFLPPPGWDDPTTPVVEASATYDDPATTDVETYPIVWPDTMPMSPLGAGSKVYDNSSSPGAWIDWPGSPQTVQNSSWGTTIESGTTRYAKGDLRMRATAVYHYAADNQYGPGKPDPFQKPIACISSYYDPSTSLTAKNLSDLPYNPGTDDKIGSNNGIVYGVPDVDTGRPAAASTPEYPTTGSGLLGGATPTELERQANYVFPNGRFANEPLRKALLQDPANRTLADNAAIDATLCSLAILDGSITPSDTLIPHGAIKEVAFLDGREIKAIDRNDPGTTVDETFTLSSPLTGTQKAKLTGNYDLALEERQPLEIRATVLDLDQLRKKEITQANDTGPTPEYLLPDSGIIYATRDDALPDRSDRQEISPGVFNENTSKTVSPTDFHLDPTRRPNAIMLINGEKLFRKDDDTPTPVTTVEEVVREKGLTLVSNLPVYIKGEFNQHTHEEFTETLNATATNFYSRSTLDPSFACREGDPRLPNCDGDKWRPATVLADALTILSSSFREGFRNEGDFDLRNNVGGATFNSSTIPSLPAPQPATQLRRDQGFYNNNFVTNGLSSGAFAINGELGGAGTRLNDSSYSDANTTGNGLNSSYFNNFTTPVQRRGNYPEYLMEVCTKLPVSACTESDWFVDPGAAQLKANDPTIIPGTTPYAPSVHKAGTTADLPDTTLQRFPRRVAFKRDVNNTLQDSTNVDATDIKVAALGIGTGGTIVAVDSTSTTTPVLPPKANSLWFATATSVAPYPAPDFGNEQAPYFLNAVTLPAADDGFEFIDGLKQPSKISSNLKLQPLLMPVLQIHSPKGAPTAGTAFPTNPGTETEQAQSTRWVSHIEDVNPKELNLIIAAGDVPSRPGEFNGGLQNLPRFLENWRGGGGIFTKISGAFVQLNRSAYATAPLSHRLGDSSKRAFSPTISGATAAWYPDRYTIGNNNNSTPFFIPPGRSWGFDVGLLSQSPDLFTQRFTAPPTQTKPAEYFREVNRNDEWVQTLLCAVDDKDPTKNAVSDNLRPTSFCTSKTGG